MKRKRILHVNIDNNGGNGAFSLVRYLYEHLSDDYIFDYYTMGNFVKDAVWNEIIQNGGLCESANLRKNKLLGHILLPYRFYKFLKKNSYEVVHIHSEVAYKHFLYAIAAKAIGTKKIIIHSHSNDIDGDNKGLKLLLHNFLRKRVNKYGTYFLACSQPAADWMFDKSVLTSNKFFLLCNGIAPEKYRFSEAIRERKRVELGVNNKIVVGHVGGLKKVKNQSFLVDIISKLDANKYVLILVGDGEDKEKITEKVKQLKCEKRVMLLGSRNDVNEILQAMDIFVFPSFFEGIPMALIEAQSVGLPALVSNAINRDIRINNNVFFYSLKKNANDWADFVEANWNKHLKTNGYDNINHSIYNIKNSAEKLREIYK